MIEEIKVVSAEVKNNGDSLRIEFEGPGINWLSSERPAKEWYNVLFLKYEVQELRKLNRFLNDQLNDAMKRNADLLREKPTAND